MYSNYDNSSQFGNFYSIPFQEENDSYLPYYERQFGPMFPPPGAGAGIQPPGPLKVHRQVKVQEQVRQVHHHQLLFRRSHNKLKLSQLIQGVLEDVCSDLLMFGYEIVSNFGTIQHLLDVDLSRVLDGMVLDGYISV
ncbi:hypothetical protein [Halalkalibacter krulwichiae]|uniref:Uncharacterized protein n=1 Tax=Halalkalibacter krulwichiae TaxID=199441 RepID=A0A1X9MBN1_9BACI|nr:hypothetical protein [Halalkalibacter krulwichiae]ARK30869.1 hypothetical protein BkAM31D_14040 [Halalkalibacter krulwichiae]